MNFEIKDGLGKIKNSVNGGDCFYFMRPLTFCWDDNRGSIAQYLCSLPYSKTYRSEIQNSISSNIFNDFSKNIEELHKVLLPLFKLFPNGDYSLSFYNSEEKELFKYQTSRDKFEEYHLGDWGLQFGNLTVVNEEEQRINEHQRFLAKNAITKEYYQSDLLDYSTYNFYPNNTSFLATQPKEEIDLDKVEHFESEIGDGKRPFAIV